jgi:phosphoglycerate kinase
MTNRICILEILRLAKEKGVQIHIPVDVVANAFSNDAETKM